MTATVYDFPPEWNEWVVTQKFNLRSMSQFSARPWSGGRNVRGPHTQIWLCDVTMKPMRDPDRADLDALLARLRGSSGLLRMYDVSRVAPWHDRHLAATTSGFSDGSTFTDGSGFANGYLPPEVFVSESAARGARYLVLGGFPPSSDVTLLHRGDLLQVKPGGVPGTVPHLYKTMFPGKSDSAGRIGVEIEPGLRQGVAAGDAVGMRYASSVFHLADDSQGDIEMSGGGVGNTGFSLIEALDMVP